VLVVWGCLWWWISYADPSGRSTLIQPTRADVYTHKYILNHYIYKYTKMMLARRPPDSTTHLHIHVYNLIYTHIIYTNTYKIHTKKQQVEKVLAEMGAKLQRTAGTLTIEVRVYICMCVYM
jgi:hypothetical protein